MNVLDAQAIAEENADLKRQLAELRNTHSLVTSMLNETLRLPEPLDLVEMPGRVAAAFGSMRAELAQLRQNPLVTWEEGEGFQVNGVTVRAAVDPAVGGAELYTPCVPVSMIGKRGILRFTVAEEVPPGEAHFRNGAGELVGKIVNLGVDLAAGPDQTVAFSEDFQTRDGEAAAHALDGEWLQPSTNPFGHGCCDCGLYHDVAFRLVDENGEGENFFRNQIESGALNLQLSFTRNETETARLRAHQGRG